MYNQWFHLRSSLKNVLSFVFRVEESLIISQQIFGYICCATAEWNNVFSMPVLFLLATKLVTASFSLFGVVQGLFIEEILLTGVHWLLFIVVVTDCLMLLVVFGAADKPVDEVTQPNSIFSRGNLLKCLFLNDRLSYTEMQCFEFPTVS